MSFYAKMALVESLGFFSVWGMEALQIARSSLMCSGRASVPSLEASLSTHSLVLEVILKVSRSAHAVGGYSRDYHVFNLT